jgi:RNA polymerase sigma-70 factor (ECF subfamily)
MRRARQPFPRRSVYCFGHATGTSELTSEDELIRRAQGGDLEAFCGLARAYERRVYALALHYCRRPEDAEDLSQEVWLKAFRSLGGFRRESSFHTWLCRITVNTFLNHKRSATLTRDGVKTTLRLDSLEELLEEPRGRGDVEEDIQRKVLADRVLSALGELSEQQRLIFLLKHREGFTCREVADATGCSIGSVKKSLFRSLEKLRASFGLAASEEEGREL